MPLYRVKIKIERATGKVISTQILEKSDIPEKQVGEMLVTFLTGKSIKDAAEEFFNSEFYKGKGGEK